MKITASTTITLDTQTANAHELIDALTRAAAGMTDPQAYFTARVERGNRDPRESGFQLTIRVTDRGDES